MFSSLHMFSLSPGWIGFLFYYDIVGSLLAKGDIHIWETKQWLTSELLITKWIEKAMSSVIGPLNCNNHPCLLLHLFSAKAKGTVFGEVPWSVILYLITHYNHHPCGNTACKAGCTLWPELRTMRLLLLLWSILLCFGVTFIVSTTIYLRCPWQQTNRKQ